MSLTVPFLCLFKKYQKKSGVKEVYEPDIPTSALFKVPKHKTPPYKSAEA